MRSTFGVQPRVILELRVETQPEEQVGQPSRDCLRPSSARRRSQKSNGEETFAILTKLAYWKVMVVNICHSPTTLTGYLTIFTFLKLIFCVSCPLSRTLNMLKGTFLFRIWPHNVQWILVSTVSDTDEISRWWTARTIGLPLLDLSRSQTEPRL